MRSPDFALKAAFFNCQVCQKINNTKILLRRHDLEDIQTYTIYLLKVGYYTHSSLLIYLKVADIH